MEELTDDQKHANYCRLIETIGFIEKNGRITEDWMEEQKKFIKDIREYFYQGIQTLNPEIKEKEFRTIANESEILLNSLLTCIYFDNTFKIGHYHNLLKRLLRMFVITYEQTSETDELTDFMQKMRL
jgi:hypothetical protein